MAFLRRKQNVIFCKLFGRDGWYYVVYKNIENNAQKVAIMIVLGFQK